MLASAIIYSVRDAHSSTGGGPSTFAKANLDLFFAILTGKTYTLGLLRTLNSRTPFRARLRSSALGRRSLSGYEWADGEGEGEGGPGPELDREARGGSGTDASGRAGLGLGLSPLESPGAHGCVRRATGTGRSGEKPPLEVHVSVDRVSDSDTVASSRTSCGRLGKVHFAAEDDMARRESACTQAESVRSTRNALGARRESGPAEVRNRVPSGLCRLLTTLFVCIAFR